MIRKTLALILFSLCFLPSFSQEKLEGGIYGGYYQLGYRGFHHFGIMFHVPIKRFTLNYHFALGSSLNSGVYAHCTGGAVAGLWLLSEVPDSDIGYVALLLCVLPEGVGYYLPTKGKITPHISVNPLGVEYFYRSHTGEEWGKLSCDFVARFKVKKRPESRIFLAPQVAASIIYTPGHMTSKYGLKAGITIGFEGKDPF